MAVWGAIVGRNSSLCYFLSSVLLLLPVSPSCKQEPHPISRSDSLAVLQPTTDPRPLSPKLSRRPSRAATSTSENPPPSLVETPRPPLLPALHQKRPSGAHCSEHEGPLQVRSFEILALER